MATTLPCWAIPVPHPLSVSQIASTVAHRTVPAGNAKRPTDRFLDAQIGELCALHRRLKRISRRLQLRILVCQAGLSPVDMLTAPVLVNLCLEAQHLEALMGEVVDQNRQSLRQAQASYCQKIIIEQVKP